MSVSVDQRTIGPESSDVNALEASDLLSPLLCLFVLLDLLVGSLGLLHGRIGGGHDASPPAASLGLLRRGRRRLIVTGLRACGTGGQGGLEAAGAVGRLADGSLVSGRGRCRGALSLLDAGCMGSGVLLLKHELEVPEGVVFCGWVGRGRLGFGRRGTLRGDVAKDVVEVVVLGLGRCLWLFRGHDVGLCRLSFCIGIYDRCLDEMRFVGGRQQLRYKDGDRR